MRAGVVEHRASIWGWGENSEAEKRQCCLSQDDACHSNSCLHQKGLHDVAKDTSDDDAEGRWRPEHGRR